MSRCRRLSFSLPRLQSQKFVSNKIFLLPTVSRSLFFLRHSDGLAHEAIRETFMWFLYCVFLILRRSPFETLNVEGHKCIDVSFICRHFGDNRGLIKIGSIGDGWWAAVEHVPTFLAAVTARLVLQWRRQLSRMKTFPLWSLHNQFFKTFLPFIICMNSDATANCRSIGEKLQFFFRLPTIDVDGEGSEKLWMERASNWLLSDNRTTSIGRSFSLIEKRIMRNFQFYSILTRCLGRKQRDYEPENFFLSLQLDYDAKLLLAICIWHVESLGRFTLLESRLRI